MEAWLPIVGFERLYSVSDCGRVRSESRLMRKGKSGTCWMHGRILTAVKDDRGRQRVTLSRDGSHKATRPHQLVMESFVGPRPANVDICHYDGDPSNNHLSNLRYDTRRSNAKDAIRHGRIAAGEKHHKAKLTRELIAAIRSDQRTQRVIAADVGISQQQICRIKRGESWASVKSQEETA